MRQYQRQITGINPKPWRALPRIPRERVGLAPAAGASEGLAVGPELALPPTRDHHRPQGLPQKAGPGSAGPQERGSPACPTPQNEIHKNCPGTDQITFEGYSSLPGKPRSWRAMCSRSPLALLELEYKLKERAYLTPCP